MRRSPPPDRWDFTVGLALGIVAATLVCLLR